MNRLKIPPSSTTKKCVFSSISKVKRQLTAQILVQSNSYYCSKFPLDRCLFSMRLRQLMVRKWSLILLLTVWLGEQKKEIMESFVKPIMSNWYDEVSVRVKDCLSRARTRTLVSFIWTNKSMLPSPFVTATMKTGANGPANSYLPLIPPSAKSQRTTAALEQQAIRLSPTKQQQQRGSFSVYIISSLLFITPSPI